MIQVEDNYFKVFDLEPSFDLDLHKLGRRFRQLQAEVHPDRFANAEEPERIRAVQLTSYLNQAYQVLKTPLQRAGYLLEIAGQRIEHAEQADLPMELLLEQMQLREKLEALPKDETALPQLEELKAETLLRLDSGRKDFSLAMGRKEIDEAKKIYHELQFLEKLMQEIDHGEEIRLGY